MAANKGGDSKNGLIIALVIFIILALGLGVSTYYGYAEQDTLRSKAKEAEGKEATMKKNRDYWQYLAQQEKQHLGWPLPKAEAENLAVQKEAFKSGQMSGGDNVADYQKMFSELETTLVNNKASESFRERAARLTADVARLQAELDKTQQALKKAKSDFDQELSTKQQEADDFRKKYQEALAKNLKDRSDLEKAFEDKLKEFGELNTKIGSVTKKSEASAEDWEKLKKRYDAQVKSLQAQISKLNEKLTPLDLTKFDQPKGKIIRIDPKGEVAWINVGSADNVRPSLTFSIFGVHATGKSNDERKGSLEVVDPIEAHVSMCKITDVVDPGRNPLVTGDLLVNPAWSPTNRTHVAVAGLIDLTGEGRDTTEEFMRNLRREGIVIDAYLDLRDQTIKGEGMTLKTDYLIVGEHPSFGDSQPLKSGDARFERKTAIEDKMSAMQKQANELGVTVVPFRRFVVLTGYRLPKSVGVNPGAGYDFIRPSETLTPESKGKKTDKPAAKAEKKDDEDK
ncbi:MAG: hypothetical protein C5B58_09455 [Acidobacteria bacterium]|nr:MAG: hypothetical protein C5B58_09455 [Acidobacteriota bacterium]